MFDVLVHADWSRHPRGRWAATARRDGVVWRVDAPCLVGDLDRFRDGLLAVGRDTPVLAGFDFPIGLPVAYGSQTGLRDFPTALRAFEVEKGWEDVFQLAVSANDVSIRQPFFPAGTGRGARKASLLAGLGLATGADLLRACERGAPGRRQASPLFWTVGAAQVGRAAIVGWRHVVAPARRAGARLWPFDGALDDLAKRPSLVLAETYPADAYGLVGAAFARTESKRRQADRRRKAPAIRRWAAAAGADLTACASLLDDGFGAPRNGEDAFDALLGLLAMIAAADGRRTAMSEALPPAQAAWEGWILGR